MTGMEQRLQQALDQGDRVAGFDRRIWQLHTRRTVAVEARRDWQELREKAAAIKAHTLARLDHYLEQFADQAEAAGAKLHYAADGGELNRIVADLLRAHGAQDVTKSKSMTTEECGMNEHLEGLGVRITDTDLGERIVQLKGEPPSHLLAPAIHRSAEEIGELFADKLGTPKGEQDPGRLTAAAREHLRPMFLQAQAGITGVNFAVAETGTITVVENEGNSLLTTSIPELHIAVMGIEKLVPRLSDLGIFLNLLARSGTGQRISIYTTHYTGPQNEPGRDRQLHIVVLDNGRTRVLSDGEHARSLSCIRCGACLNVCPVYRRSLGHAYGWTYPGPIGSVLAPAMAGSTGSDLPFASSLCGACSEVCPVQIDLHRQLIRLRASQVRSKAVRPHPIRRAKSLMKHARLFRLASRPLRWGWARRLLLRRWQHESQAGPSRIAPTPADQTFHQWWKQRGGEGGGREDAP